MEHLWEKCVAFHGHACPGLAIGFRAAEAAHVWLGMVGFSQDEALVCVTENDACGVDAIQVLLGCSMGKGNLIYKDTGKQAFSFFDRKNGKSGRIVFKRPLNPDFQRQQLQEHILTAPIEELFELKKPHFTLPESARLFASKVCEICGESAPEHKMRLQKEKIVCLDCFSPYDRGWK
ncbi:MAG: FmdE family protein [Sulfurospirillaceae bacterium]|nr:FmdE family protein [Sulfurospirillaceae bacterium]